MSTRTQSTIEAQKRYDAKTEKVNVRLSPETVALWGYLAAREGVSKTALLKRWILEAQAQSG